MAAPLPDDPPVGDSSVVLSLEVSLDDGTHGRVDVRRGDSPLAVGTAFGAAHRLSPAATDDVIQAIEENLAPSPPTAPRTPTLEDMIRAAMGGTGPSVSPPPLPPPHTEVGTVGPPPVPRAPSPGSPSADAAAALIRFLTSPEAAAAVKKAGLTPVAGR